MSLTYGFYNSLNGDRKYNALDVSRIFDGLIIDGVFASIGTAFVVKASTPVSSTVSVGIGKAWFDHTWTYNDAILPMTMPPAEVLLNRIDAIVLEVNTNARENSIKIVTGTPNSSPTRPALLNDEAVHQYPLCYIRREHGVDSIRQADIKNTVGTSECPFVTGVLRTLSLDELLGQWQDQLDQYLANQESHVNTWINGQENDFTDWFNDMKADLQSEKALLDQWVEDNEGDFLNWYNEMRGKLDEDAAGHLELQINRADIERILIIGLSDGTKTIGNNGRTITTVASDGRTLIKEFSSDFLTMTVTLKNASNAEVARLVKVFSPDGHIITTTITYLIDPVAEPMKNLPSANGVSF